MYARHGCCCAAGRNNDVRAFTFLDIRGGPIIRLSDFGSISEDCLDDFVVKAKDMMSRRVLSTRPRLSIYLLNLQRCWRLAIGGSARHDLSQDSYGASSGYGLPPQAQAIMWSAQRLLTAAPDHWTSPGAGDYRIHPGRGPPIRHVGASPLAGNTAARKRNHRASSRTAAGSWGASFLQAACMKIASSDATAAVRCVSAGVLARDSIRLVGQA